MGMGCFKKGLHQIEGFDTSVSDDPNHGETFADYMIVNKTDPSCLFWAVHTV